VRVLVSLEGPEEGGTRAALGRLSFDELHLIATDPDGETTQRVCDLAESFGARVERVPVPYQDLVGAREVLRKTIDGLDGEVIAQINAGPDANQLSAAGMLVCMHEGIEMHFLHEEGHTPLPILTEAPIERLLDEAARDQLAQVPDDGIALDATGDHDERALNGLKDEDLIQPEGDRLVLTDRGRSYREHVRRQT
jgi:hypothetical protein